LNFRPVQAAFAGTVTTAPGSPRVNATGRVPEIVRPFVEESGEIVSTFMPDFLPTDFSLALTFSVVVYICLNEHFIVSYYKKSVQRTLVSSGNLTLILCYENKLL